MRRSVPGVLFAVGVVLLLVGLVPMLAALVVGNRLIDDGHDPGDEMIIQRWNSWAFTPRFIVSAVVGAGILVAGVVMSHQNYGGRASFGSPGRMR